MLELKVELKQVIEPLVYEALKTPLKTFTEKHQREADLATTTFRKKIARLAAGYFAKRQGAGHWRGIITRNATNQPQIDVTRLRSHYRTQVKMTGIFTEIIKLTK